MNYNNYREVSMGQNISEVVVRYGAPYEVRKLPSGLEEYVYIEHVTTGAKSSAMREYIIVVADGRVIDKKSNETQAPSLRFSH